MRYGTGLGILAVILSIGPGVVAQEEAPSPTKKASSEAGPSEGRTAPQEKSKLDRPGRRFGGDEGMPADIGGFPFDEEEGPMMVEPDAGSGAQAQTTTMEYLAAIGTLALAFAVVTAVTVMRVRRVLSADATFKLIALTLIVGAGLYLLRSSMAQELKAPMMVVLGTALGFVFGKQMGSTVTQESPVESRPVATPPA